jgi:vancomycin resistance protein YoaR
LLLQAEQNKYKIVCVETHSPFIILVMSYVNIPRPQRPPLTLQVLTALVGGVLVFVAFTGFLSGGVRLFFAGHILPGVSVAGVDLSNQDLEEAGESLRQKLTYPQNGTIVFRYQDEVWVTHPYELGLVFDVGASVDEAYGAGRGELLEGFSEQLSIFTGGWQLAPVIVFDERVAHGYLQNMGLEINRPVREAVLTLTGGEVQYTPGQIGRTLDVDETLKLLKTQLNKFADGEVPLIINEIPPDILDASTEAEALRGVLRTPMTLQIPDPQAGDPGPWTLESWQVAEMISVGRAETDSGWKAEILVDTHPIELLLEQVAPQIDRNPENARFYFDDPTGELVLIESAKVGRLLDIGASLEAVKNGILAGETDISLILKTEQPQVGDDATAQSLGISGLVTNGAYTTYFRGSGSERLQNIDAARAQFHGLLVAPYATFSMGEAIGDISLDNGYAEALIIYNGQTITGVGGGVCQVSTTLFRTAFFAGYPIVERHEHAYRVGYYEQKPGSGSDTALAGLDATVYFPLVDLKLTNDRPYWLLMETYFNPEVMSLTWKFYSTDDGRTVEWKNLGLRNVVPAPEPLYVVNDALPEGACQKVDYAADGADITVTRVVHDLLGEVLFSDNIQTHYEAWQAVFQYGPGTDDPEAACGQ